MFELMQPDTRWGWILILSGYTVFNRDRRWTFRKENRGGVVTENHPERLSDSRGGLLSRGQHKVLLFRTLNY